MEFKTKDIVVNNQDYTTIGLMNANDYKEQHLSFMKLFASSPETSAAFKNSEAFGDPTANCSREELEDSKNNYIVFPKDFIAKINKDPDAPLDDIEVLLLKPSGVYKMTYKDSLHLAFPRRIESLNKTDLNPQDFIDALNVHK